MTGSEARSAAQGARTTTLRRATRAAQTLLSVAAVAVTWWVSTPGPAEADDGVPAVPAPQQLNYGGMVADATACPAGLAMVAADGSTSCSHGPDPAPPGVDVHRGQDLDGLAVSASAGVACEGDGVTGYRIQAIYAHPANRPDRSTQVTALIPTWAAQANQAVADTAAAQGGARQLRFVTNPDCSLDVDVVHLSSTAGDDFQTMIDELKARGYNRGDRKYLVWMDELGSYCGIAQMYPDDRPVQQNWNNGGLAMFGRVDEACWGNGGSGASTEAHEIIHMLGGVQSSAPHATGFGHCTDERDVMCYVDGPGVSMQYLCPAQGNERLLDCGSDDYFNVSPANGSYLDSHWNTADSRFLMASAANSGGGETPMSSPPSIPGSVVAQADAAQGGHWSVSVTWSKPTSGVVTGYRVTASDGTTTTVGTSALSTTLHGVAPGSRTVAVVATSAAGDSPAGTSPAIWLPSVTGGYWLAGSDGGIFSFGSAPYLGSTGDIVLNRPIVAMAAHASGQGYWFVAEDGGVFAYGAAGFFGSAGGEPTSGTVTAMAAHPSGDGYWLLTSTGDVLAYGSAQFLGGGVGTDARWIGIEASPSGNGYWLVAVDGTVTARGDAPDLGDMSGTPLARPVVGMAAHPSGQGYWLVGSDGGIFSFGTAAFYGSTGDIALNQPIVGMTASSSGDGYVFVARDGGIFAYGDAAFYGSTGAMTLNRPIIGMAAPR